MGKVYLFFCVFTVVLVSSGVTNAQFSNSEPHIDKPANQTIEEDTGLQSINLTGITDNDGGTQAITLTAVSSNQTAIPNSSINIIYTSPQSTGTLEYTPSTDANGLVSIIITVMDDGGTANGGDDTYQTNFSVTINPINDKPTFTKGADQPVAPAIIYEDAGAVTKSSWATNINAGGTIGNESFQTLTFVLTTISTTGNIAFDNISINSSGTLNFTPSQNTNGTAEVKVELQDSGSDTAPNENLSDPDTVLITVTSINDPPSFTPGSDVTIVEGSGPQTLTGWATAISPGGGSDEAGQSLTFNITESNKSTYMVFLSPPEIDPATGDLTFELDPESNGTATYTIVLEDDGSSVSPNDNTSTVKSFTITVTPINDPPSATIPTSYDTFEDAGAVSIANFVTDITAGGPDEETSQVVSFDLEILSTTGTLSFDESPSIDEIGTFTFRTSENTNGTAQLLVSVFDDGLSESPHNNVGPVVTLTISITAVNDRPTFTKGSNITLLEDNGPTTFTAWATNISPGPSDESGQSVNFQVSQVWTEGTLSFTAEPTITTSGDLSFETSLNTNGRAAYEIILVDDGPTGGLNLNTSAVQNLIFEIDAVNDPPEYIIGPDQTADENIGLVTVEGWATEINPGGGTDEADQSVNFTPEITEVTGSLVFTIGPVISPTGDLSFQSAPNTFGSVLFLLKLADDGPSDPPNNNTNDTQSFTITVNEINDPPTDILLSNNAIQEKLPIGTFIGTFSAVDPDDLSHTFSLVGGLGADDNSSFTIDGDQLLSNATFDYRERNLYSIRVSAADAESSIEQVFLIDIVREPVSSVTYFSAFTPNGDGENDTWEIGSIEYFPGAVITIYNRNGQKVFESIGYLDPWDGTYDGQDLPMDTYYAVIKLNNDIEVINTTVTILR